MKKKLEVVNISSGDEESPTKQPTVAPASKKIKPTKEVKEKEDAEIIPFVKTETPEILLLGPKKVVNRVPFYNGFLWNNVLFKEGDHCELSTGSKQTFIGRINSIWMDDQEGPMFRCQWYFKQNEVPKSVLHSEARAKLQQQVNEYSSLCRTELGSKTKVKSVNLEDFPESRELFSTDSFCDDNLVSAVCQKVEVKHFLEIDHPASYFSNPHAYFYRLGYIDEKKRLYFDSLLEHLYSKGKSKKKKEIKVSPYLDGSFDLELLPEDKDAKVQASSSENEHDPTSFVPCLYGLPEKDKFELEIDRETLIQIDFHAHLSKLEVIGLLGGHWDAEKKVLKVCRAFPTKSVVGETGKTNVEMDPISQLEAEKKCEAEKLKVVGWYHSHTEFEPYPSVRDVQNQYDFQTLIRNEFPFIGIICGVFDRELPTPVSAVNVFWTKQLVKGELNEFPFGIAPYAVPYKLTSLEKFPSKTFDIISKEMLPLFKQDKDRVDLKKTWPAKQKEKLSYGAKLTTSVGTRFPKDYSEQKKNKLLSETLAQFEKL